MILGGRLVPHKAPKSSLVIFFMSFVSFVVKQGFADHAAISEHPAR